MMIGLRNYIKQKKLLADNRGLSLGKDCTIIRSSFGHNVRIDSNVTLLDSSIMDYSYVGPKSSVCNTEIGKFCSVGPETYLGTGSHPSKVFVSTHPIFYLARPAAGWALCERNYRQEFEPTRIGNDVWIGLRVAVRDGVNIGDGAIIGAGSVVVEDVKPYGVYVGTPAKLLRYRFKEGEIEFLLSFRWWDKSDQWLKDNYQRFHNIQDFMLLVDN